MTQSHQLANLTLRAFPAKTASCPGRRGEGGQPASVPAFDAQARLQRCPPRPRRGERGAALLIVATVLSMLAVVGAYAAASTARVHRAAGQARIAARNRAVAEQGMGAQAAAAAIAGFPKLQLSQLELATPDAADSCGATAHQRTLMPQEQETWHCDRHDLKRLEGELDTKTLLTSATDLLDQREHGVTTSATNPTAWTGLEGEDATMAAERYTIFVEARYGGPVGGGVTSCAGALQTSVRRGVGTLVLQPQTQK